MKNKIFKIIIVLGLLFFIIIGGMLTFIMYALPSTKTIGQAVGGQKTAQAEQIQNSDIQSGDQTEMFGPVSNDSTSADVSKSEEKNTVDQLNRDLMSDLMDADRPLSNFCISLKNAKSGRLSSSDLSSGFVKGIDPDTADPRIQAMKPLLRSVFRQQTMKELILEAEAAIQNKEENFWQKAAFYSKAAMAFRDLVANKSELEAVSDRSYLFIKINELVAKRPDLLNDDRLQKFCNDTENALNTNDPVQFEQEKKNFERILTEMNVAPTEIKYDSNYKTKLDAVYDGMSMRLEGGWLEEVFPNKPTVK